MHAAGQPSKETDKTDLRPRQPQLDGGGKGGGRREDYNSLATLLNYG